MTEQEFIKKYSRQQYGDWWNGDASRIFWAASYKMSGEKLEEMSKDFLSIIGIKKYSSSWHKAKQTTRYQITGPIKKEGE